jgi:hypothetical protein
MLNLSPRFCSIASSVDTIGFVSLFVVDIIHAHQREKNLKTLLAKFLSIQSAVAIGKSARIASCVEISSASVELQNKVINSKVITTKYLKLLFKPSSSCTHIFNFH